MAGFDRFGVQGQGTPSGDAMPDGNSGWRLGWEIEIALTLSGGPRWGSEGMGDVFLKRLEELQPSQLFVSAEKLSRVMREDSAVAVEGLEPVPVKKLGDRVVLTDGHTRALAAVLSGLAEIRVFWDEDDLDWEAYEICVAWCREEGIHSVADLEDRVVSSKAYKEVWLERCQEMRRELEQRRRAR